MCMSFNCVERKRIPIYSSDCVKLPVYGISLLDRVTNTATIVHNSIIPMSGRYELAGDVHKS